MVATNGSGYCRRRTEAARPAALPRKLRTRTSAPRSGEWHPPRYLRSERELGGTDAQVADLLVGWQRTRNQVSRRSVPVLINTAAGFAPQVRDIARECDFVLRIGWVPPGRLHPNSEGYSSIVKLDGMTGAELSRLYPQTLLRHSWKVLSQCTRMERFLPFNTTSQGREWRPTSR